MSAFVIGLLLFISGVLQAQGTCEYVNDMNFCFADPPCQKYAEALSEIVW